MKEVIVAADIADADTRDVAKATAIWIGYRRSVNSPRLTRQ